jgi:hypothetical protein
MNIRKIKLEDIEYIYDFDQCHSVNNDESLNFILYPLDREREEIIIAEKNLLSIPNEVVEFQDRCYRSEEEYLEIIENVIQDITDENIYKI